MDIKTLLIGTLNMVMICLTLAIVTGDILC